MRPPDRVVVVGGGIAGLTVAYRLVRGRALGTPDAPEVTLVEAGDRLGGKLRSLELAGLDLEAGADSFVVRKPWAVDLCTELGLEDALVVPAARSASVWTGDRLIPFPGEAAFGVPATVRGVLGWPGLTRAARLRGLLDLYRPPRRAVGDESLAALVDRRLGPEATRVLLGPLLAGIHAGDPARLSVQATFPELSIWERGHGSLIRGARAARKAARTEKAAIFATVWGGLSRLVRSLEDAIGADRIRRGGPAVAVDRTEHGFEVEWDGQRVPAAAVVLATPAFESARLLSSLNPAAAGELAGISYASTAVVALVYPEGTADRLPQGTGFVVPIGERTITACTWVSRKWPQDAFGGRAVVRCYVGRAGEEDALALPDGDLVAAVAADVGGAVPALPTPETSRVVRWNRSMPQYEVGHLDRLDRIDRALRETSGLFLVGSAYRGVGIADCIRQGNEVARRVRDHIMLAGSREGPPAPPVGDDEREAISWTT